MSLRGRDVRSIHAPGLLQHGSFPLPHPPPLHPHPANHLPPPVPHFEILERKLSTQLSEMRNLENENRHLAKSHAAMRQDIVSSQKETDSVQAHISGVCSETDAKIRGIFEKIKGFEAEMRIGDSLQVELHQKHVEAQALVAAREELGAEMRHVAEELERSSKENRKLVEMFKELDGLRLEHQKLRSTFEHEKGTNIKQVEKMRGMEKNLISMAGEIEKLRVDVANAQNRLQQVNAAQNQAVQYQNQGPAYQTAAYGNQGYNQGVPYPPGTHYSYPVPAYNQYQNAYVGAQAVGDGTSLANHNRNHNQYGVIAGYPAPAVHYAYDPSGGATAAPNKQV